LIAPLRISAYHQLADMRFEDEEEKNRLRAARFAPLAPTDTQQPLEQQAIGRSGNAHAPTDEGGAAVPAPHFRVSN
jgi:hypothetical protein